MFLTHSKRAGRLAACTALALSAGMLLAGTASADNPSPRPSATKRVAEKKAPSFTPPKLALPQREDVRMGAATATAGARLQSDLDRDGFEDIIFRAVDGQLYSSTSSGQGGAFELFRTEDVAKEIVPIGNQGGTGEPEVLVLSENGTLKLYRDADPYGSPYESTVGGGWQIYNKISSPGDLNGDGRADVIARTKDGSLYLYLATGNLSKPLGARTLIGGGWGAYDQIVGFGDANRDGRGDLYARDTAGTLWFYAGTGKASAPFGARKAIGGGWGVYTQLLPGGDGFLLARDQKGSLYVYAGKGNGTLAAPQKSGSTGSMKGIVHFANGGGNPYTGKEGIFATTPAGALYWYNGSTTGSLDPRVLASDNGGYDDTFVPLHFSSLNQDALSDLGFLFEGVLYVEGAEIGPGWDVYDTIVGPGDLTGDGKGDLLARDRSGVLYLYAGNGAGTAFGGRIKVGPGWGSYDKLVGAGDYTGDGRTDLLATTPGGDLYLYGGTGSATAPFKGRVKIGPGWQTYGKLVAPGDLNADGKADLIGVAHNGDLYTYLNTAPGKFSGRVKFGPGFQIYNKVF
ncbi:FG-GAP-like repeat-containing protein [Streptomyces bikiniensis]|uniref:FG-GAP-like repeat-containing protein n=1 Tax=Streptomyces bikiniensis TaxID=1896 RepID=UPI0004C07E65|nr:FG-GAP-like repeat-containing protein [Streptomyces bikiniensis]